MLVNDLLKWNYPAGFNITNTYIFVDDEGIHHWLMTGWVGQIMYALKIRIYRQGSYRTI